MGLEAAIAELGTLYAAARQFVALHAAAEGDLLPRLNELSRRLRSAARREQLSNGEADRAAREIVGLAMQWRDALEGVRRSATYQQALECFQANHQADLLHLLPAIFTGLSPVPSPVPPVYLPFSPSAHRRHPGANPFRAPDACVAEIRELLATGVAPQVSGSEWWDRDLPRLDCVDNPALLDSVIALQIEQIPAALFATEAGSGLAIFTAKLCAPFSVRLAPEANDEWWQTSNLPYGKFCEALTAGLTGHGIAVAQN